MKIVRGHTSAFLVACLLLAGTANGQTLKDIETLKKNGQECLDKGVDMKGCAKHYCFQMDSILSVACERLGSKLKGKEKEAFKKEHTDWLKKKKKFEAAEERDFQKKFKTKEWGPDMYMIVYENDAEFIRKRAVAVVKRLNK
jgi:hypothetical protein